MEKYGGYIDMGLNDTMEDLIVNLVGASVYSIMGYGYLKGKGSNVSKFKIKKDK